VVSAFLYGKLSANNEKASILNRIAIPKRWFVHFYIYSVVLFTIWLLILLATTLRGAPCIPAIFEFSLDVLVHNRAQSVPFAVSVLVQIMATMQVYRRCYECLYVSVYSDAKMHIWHYAMAFIFYTGVQYSILSLTFGGEVADFSFRISDLFSLHVLIGIAVFAASYWLEHDITRRFANFRKDSTGKVVSSRHEVPHGGMFELVSSPHYFAEIMIYAGMSIVLWSFNFTWFCCVMFTWVNQISLAFLNHDWYQSNFKSYPKSRKAIIPFIA